MHTTAIRGRKNCLLLVKTRDCWIIRLYSPDHFKAPTLESERGQTVIKLLLSLPYDGETYVTLQWKDFKTALANLAWCKEEPDRVKEKEIITNKAVHFAASVL